MEDWVDARLRQARANAARRRRPNEHAPCQRHRSWLARARGNDRAARSGRAPHEARSRRWRPQVGRNHHAIARPMADSAPSTWPRCLRRTSSSAKPAGSAATRCSLRLRSCSPACRSRGSCRDFSRRRCDRCRARPLRYGNSTSLRRPRHDRSLRKSTSWRGRWMRCASRSATSSRSRQRCQPSDISSGCSTAYWARRSRRRVALRGRSTCSTTNVACSHRLRSSRSPMPRCFRTPRSTRRSESTPLVAPPPN